MNYKILIPLFISIPLSFPFALTPDERRELMGYVQDMCAGTSSFGEVLTYEADLEAGGVLRLAGGQISGRVNGTSWNNINQAFGDYRNEPVTCRTKMLEILTPIFTSHSENHSRGEFSAQAGEKSGTALSATPGAALGVYVGPDSASAGSATPDGAHTSHSR